MVQKQQISEDDFINKIYFFWQAEYSTFTGNTECYGILYRVINFSLVLQNILSQYDIFHRNKWNTLWHVWIKMTVMYKIKINLYQQIISREVTKLRNFPRFIDIMCLKSKKYRHNKIKTYAAHSLYCWSKLRKSRSTCDGDIVAL